MNIDWKPFLTIKNILIAILIVVVVVQSCQKQQVMKVATVSHTIDTIRVTLPPKIVVIPGKDIPHDSTIYVPVPANVDTAKILKEYFATNVYKDKFVFDEGIGSVSIVDTITQNNIKTRKWTANVNKFIVKETTVVTAPPKRQLYFGVDADFNTKSLINAVGAGFILKSKNDRLYKLGIGVANSSIGESSTNITPYIGAGMYWKIKLKK